ncbi:MAG: protein kinase [Acidobacteriota bacterium]|nr:protein kinase [Acidobacteriota bacterium]
MPPNPDARLSNYRLDRLLGTGGMGAVYLARDLALDRPVAIKFITADRAADGSSRKRLLREAKAAAALDHPNICAVYEVIDDPDGRACIVMQYLEGETLADVLDRGPLDVRFALGIAADVASALAEAHAHGIVHRDLKPQNIMITVQKQAKLVDFGLARHNDPAPATAGNAATTTALTTPGIIVGTPAYMSPEQARQLPLDGRSDLFSLGAILYECLTGQRAFKGRTPIELAGQVLHQQPADVSGLRRGLTEQHDELCRRLLAKHPDDRFRSAEELLGALRVFSSDTARGLATPARETVVRRLWGSGGTRAAVLVGAALILAILTVFILPVNIPTEPANPQAAVWYRRGTAAVRDGAYHSARLALSEAVKAAPGFAPAYIRMAEAETELGEVERAQQALLKVSDLVSRETRLAFVERKRTQGVRALMLRDVDGAVRAYTELAASQPDDPGAWLDLGRAQDAAALSADARASYERAIQLDGQYAAAHLRRASILGLEGRDAEALAAFSEAERLYRAGANVEGEVETLIRLGTMLNSAGELRRAGVALERANDLARRVQSHAQHIRAQLTLSSVTASEGKWDQAEHMAAAAVDSALREHLEAVAADGLVDLANVLILLRKTAEADGHLVRAIQLAERRGAPRIVARATLQRAAILVDSGRAMEGIAAARGPLNYFRDNRYRRYELMALSVISRAHESLGEYSEAQALAERALRAALEIKDESQAGQALENLAGQANAVGALPAALDYRTRGLEIHRRQNDIATLSFDLVNRADLLIRLGRHSDAAVLLDEIDAGIAAKLDAFAPRARRVKVLRALSAAIQRQRGASTRHARQVAPASGAEPDLPARLAALLLQYLDAPGRAGIDPKVPLAGSLSAPGSRELRYWDLLGRLGRHDIRNVLVGVDETLSTPLATVSYEFEWRIAAIGAAAARQLRDTAREHAFNERARRGLARLRKEWKADVGSYEARADLADLRRKAGLN